MVIRMNYVEKELLENLDVTKLYAFDNPRRILFGLGALRNIGAEAKRFGSKGLIVTDEPVEKAGLTTKLVPYLEREGIRWEIFKRDQGREPSIGSMNNAAEFIRQHQYDLIIGLGGGSVLDTAKIMAMTAKNQGRIEQYMDLEKPIEVQNDKLPLILMPTTAGTGSEVTPFAVAIDEKTGLKSWMYSKKLYADLSLIDPIMTLSCPQSVTAQSGMDALSQSIESILAADANPLSEMFGLEAVKLISENLARAYHQGENLEARKGMALGAMIGGWVLGFPWSGGGILGHCIAETIGPKLGIPHGLACALALPYIMEFNRPAANHKLALIASAMSEDTKDLPRNQRATFAIQFVLRLMKDIDVPTSLRNVTSKIDAPLLSETIFERRSFYARNPRKLTQENCLEVLEKMWEGNCGCA